MAPLSSRTLSPRLNAGTPLAFALFAPSLLSIQSGVGVDLPLDAAGERCDCAPCPRFVRLRDPPCGDRLVEGVLGFSQPAAEEIEGLLRKAEVWFRGLYVW